MTNNEEKNISQLFEEGTPIDNAILAAGRNAILEHKQKGQPLVVWRDGKTVLIPPEELDEPSVPRINPR
ncbi:MAG: hypothetical protein JXB10_11035 [Pirellulales bacterium]|nr:hypothetical protein [Pirellulales bacterium]